MLVLCWTNLILLFSVKALSSFPLFLVVTLCKGSHPKFVQKYYALKKFISTASDIGWFRLHYSYDICLLKIPNTYIISIHINIYIYAYTIYTYIYIYIYIYIYTYTYIYNIYYSN